MSTKKHLAIWAGSALLATGIYGCDAGDPGAPATEDPASENLAMYEPDDTANDQSDAMQDDPTMAEDDSMASDPMYGDDAAVPDSLEAMSDDEIVGMAILSRGGEEIGDVDEIVVDATTGDKYAVVDVGGFLGIGEKSIVVPVNELEMTNDDQIQSDFTRETLQTETEYDPANFEGSPDPL